MYETHERDDAVTMENLLTNMMNCFTTGNLMVMIMYSDNKMIILKSGFQSLPDICEFEKPFFISCKVSVQSYALSLRQKLSRTDVVICIQDYKRWCILKCIDGYFVQ